MRIPFLPAKILLRWLSLLLFRLRYLIPFLFCSLPVQAAISINDSLSVLIDGVDIYSASISADGRFVVYASDASGLGHENNVSDIYIYDVSSDRTKIVSTGLNESRSNGMSGNPVISADGRYVVFASDADNLVLGDQNNVVDIFLYQVDTETIERLPVRETESDTVLIEWNEWPTQIDLSGDGRFIVFDVKDYASLDSSANGSSKLFVYDRATQTIERIIMPNDNQQELSHAVISEDGRHIAFEAQISNSELDRSNAFTQVFLYHLETAKSFHLTVNDEGVAANGVSSHPQISDDGRYISFYSQASNLAKADTLGLEGLTDMGGIYIYDSSTESVQLVTAAGNEWPDQPINVEFDMSGDGRFVVFSSKARNLTAYWETLCMDIEVEEECFWGEASNVFRYDRLLDHVDLISVGKDGFPLPTNSLEPSTSKDGEVIIYSTQDQEGDVLGNDQLLYLATRSIASALTLVLPSEDLFEDYPTYLWNANPDAVAYRLLTEEMPISNWLSAEDLGCDISGLCSATPLVVLDYGRHSIFIQSVTEQGFFTPLSSPQYLYKRPGTPEPEELNILSGGNATLKWSEVSDAVSYRVLVQNKVTREVIFNDVVGDTVAYTLPTLLDPSIEYHWKVRAQSPAGIYSNWADINFKLAVDVPEPTLPTGSVASLAPDFSWKGVADASQYRILIQDIDTGEITNKILKQGHSYTHSELFEPNHSYRWKVRTQVPQGEYSKWAYFKILDSEASDGEHKATLKWAEPEYRVDGSPLGDMGISHYIVEYKREESGQLYTVIVTSENVQLVLDDLSEGRYQFMIKAVDNEGLAGPFSNKVTVNIPIATGH